VRRTLVCELGILVAVVGVSGCGLNSGNVDKAAAPAQPSRPVIHRTAGATGHQPIRFHALPYDGLQKHTFSRVGEDVDPVISPDGRLLAFASSRQSPTFDIYVKCVEGTTMTQVTTDAAHDMQPAFSPNGRSLTYASNRDGNWDVFVTDLTTHKSIQLTDSRQNDVHPSWSPDGRYVVYASQSGRTGEWALWIASIDSPGQRKMIGPGLFPVWHPRDGRIAFQRASRRAHRWYSIWTLEWVDEEAKYPTQIVADREWAATGPAWSPDGRRIAFATVSKGNTGPDPVGEARGGQVCVVEADGTGLIQLTAGPGSHWAPCWGSDGRIYFASDRDGHTNVWSLLPISSALGR